MNVQQRVKQFIVENFYVSDPSELADGASLIQGGWVDSTGMLELITFLEEEYGIRIADTEMTPENLDAIERIAAFVARKTTSGAGARATGS
jgi:acyl carrier protein